MSFSISVVVTFHNEGLLAVQTLESLRRAVFHAASQGFTCEVILSLDNVDEVTKIVVENWHYEHKRVLLNSFGDLGLCRNSCIDVANGESIAILDGDDMFGVNWLSDAQKFVTTDTRKVIWHPEVNILFGQDNYVFYHSDMEDVDFDVLQLFSCNPWTALSFGRRDIYRKYRYEKFDPKKGVGYEDWCWNRRVVEAGYIHKVVWGTGHVIRRKEQSLVKLVSSTRSLPSSCSIFREKLRDIADMGKYGATLRVDS